jgi:hypothetical protein
MHEIRSRFVLQLCQFLVADKLNPVGFLHVAGPLGGLAAASGLDGLNHGLPALTDVVGHQTFFAAFNLIACVFHQLEGKRLCVRKMAEFNEQRESLLNVGICLPVQFVLASAENFRGASSGWCACFTRPERSAARSKQLKARSVVWWNAPRAAIASTFLTRWEIILSNLTFRTLVTIEPPLAVNGISGNGIWFAITGELSDILDWKWMIRDTPSFGAVVRAWGCQAIGCFLRRGSRPCFLGASSIRPRSMQASQPAVPAS